MLYSKKNIFLLALIVSTFTVLPRLVVPSPGGDVIFHYMLLDCFSKQLWEGNIYPRWCIDADAGLGSPPLLFYFPLPYYLASLFYPLHHFGATVETLYLINLWVVSVVTFLTCWYWLKDIVSPGRALLCSVFFLIMPYRMELLVFRSAYSELWCVAWLPLMFLFTRRLIVGDSKNWLWLSWIVVLGLLTHVPLTLAGLFACGLQMVLLTHYRAWKPKLYFATAVLLAGAATLFYTVPAKYFSRYLYAEVLEKVRTVWANSYVTWENFSVQNHFHIMIGLSVTVLLVLGLAMYTLKNLARIEHTYLQRESKVWIIISLLAFLLLFEISDPFWRPVTEYLVAAFPWRMQILLMCVATYLLAIKSQWFMSTKQLKTWKMDYIAAVGVISLFGWFMLTTRDPEENARFDNLVSHHITQANVYRTLWTDKDNMTPEHIIIFGSDNSPRAHIIHGRGTIREQQWSWQGIVLDATLQTSSTIRLKQRYFPLWQLSIDGKAAGGLTPEDHSGLMLVHVPQGKHSVQLITDIDAVMGWRYGLAKTISMIAIGILSVLLFRYYPRSVREK